MAGICDSSGKCSFDYDNARKSCGAGAAGKCANFRKQRGCRANKAKRLGCVWKSGKCTLAAEEKESEGPHECEAIVYERDHFVKISEKYITGAYSRLSPNDQMSSIRVSQGCTATIYENYDFDGWKVVLGEGDF